MPRPFSKTSARLLSGVALPIVALACLAGPALAQTVEGSGGNRVMMFERPPTVDELREAVKPGAAPADGTEQPKIRTRSIEIIGGGMSSANRPRPTDSVNYGAPAAQQSFSPPPAPVAQPEPAPQPKPRRAPVQEAAAPPIAPPPAAPRRSNGVQPATLSAPETPAETRPTNGFGFRINFAFNSADVPREFYSYIDAVGGLMSQDPQLRLVIEGHTDAVGSDQYNLALSERRAVSVGEYLVRVHHIEPQRIAIAGLGKSQPLTPDPTDSRNRRVEFRPIQ
ncbi:OmpA family protein [Roseomonas genomospecies 6]|uniref:OmpA family protein n=1 Tax=Roseomonas genomospecies 6 TaxID=214106 RepID=A0A9W7NMV3_9PROT|nr:OmpA family protein [Roseomonas genomospecies 6]KAA0683352.1 OmpA family protein [Roseomonas genomospecies 6]